VTFRTRIVLAATVTAVFAVLVASLGAYLATRNSLINSVDDTLVAAPTASPSRKVAGCGSPTMPASSSRWSQHSTTRRSSARRLSPHGGHEVRRRRTGRGVLHRRDRARQGRTPRIRRAGEAPLDQPRGKPVLRHGAAGGAASGRVARWSQPAAGQPQPGALPRGHLRRGAGHPARMAGRPDGDRAPQRPDRIGGGSRQHHRRLRTASHPAAPTSWAGSVGRSTGCSGRSRPRASPSASSSSTPPTSSAPRSPACGPISRWFAGCTSCPPRTARSWSTTC